MSWLHRIMIGLVFPLVVAGALAVALLATVALGDPILAITFGGAGLVSGLLWWLVLAQRIPPTRGRARFRVHTLHGQPVLYADWSLRVATPAVLFTTTLGLGGMALIGVGLATQSITLLIGVVVTLHPAHVAFRALDGQAHRGHIALSPTWVEIQTWNKGVRLPWSEVDYMGLARPPQAPTNRCSLILNSTAEDSAVVCWHETIQRCPDPFDRIVRMAVISAEHCGIELHTLLAVLGHYWQHPDHRDELGTEAAVSRVREHLLVMPAWHHQLQHSSDVTLLPEERHD